MGKKLNVSAERKQVLKSNYGAITPLSDDERKYLNKIKAGKARAATSPIKVQGRYVRKDFIKEVEHAAELAGAKDVTAWYYQHEKVFEDRYNMYEVSTNRDLETIREDIRNYSGKIIYNGREISHNTALKNLAELTNYLKSEHEHYITWAQIGLSPSGKMRVTVPTVTELQSKIEDGESIEDVLQEYGMESIENTDPKKVKYSKAAKKFNAKSKVSKTALERGKRK